MIEHIRCRNYSAFFKKAYDLLKPGGRIVLHTVFMNPVTLDETSKEACCKGKTVRFVTTRIFPGGQIPKYEWIVQAATRKNRFKLVHSEGFGGQHYGRTLAKWRRSMLWDIAMM